MRLRAVMVLVLTVVTAWSVLSLGVRYAAAAPEGQLTVVENVPGEVQMILSVEGGDEGTVIDPASVTVTVDGIEVDAEATPAENAVRRATMLVMDTSGSMRGDGIAAAKDAANAYLDVLPEDVLVGLVAFSDTPKTLARPTKDRQRVREAVAGLEATGETALYDAVLQGLRAVGDEGSRSLLILSDGGDTVSEATLQETVRAVEGSGVTVDAVALRTDESATESLNAIAAAGGGQVLVVTTSEEVEEAFQGSAEEFSSQVLVTLPVPPEAAGTGRSVAVQASATGGEIEDELFLALAPADGQGAGSGGGQEPAQVAGPQPVAIATPPLTSDASFWIAGAITFAGVLLMLLALLRIRHTVSWHGEGSADVATKGKPSQRVNAYLKQTRPQDTAAPEEEEQSAVESAAVSVATRLAERLNVERRVADKIRAGNVRMTAPEFLILQVAAMAGGFAIGFLLSVGSIWAGLAGAAVGALIPTAYLNNKAQTRKNLFAEQLAETLTLLAGSLKAGYSLAQAMDTVITNGSPPMSEEFDRALRESRIGVPLEEALGDIATRMDSKDFEWVVMAVRINHEVGGSLAGVLETVAGTLREREYIRRQVKTLSAEGKLSGYVLIGMPFLVIILLSIMSPGYLSPLFMTPEGIAAFATAMMLLLVGGLWMKKTVTLEV